MNFLELVAFAMIFFHGLCMLFDEFYFHHKRKLPKWERIGHPIDTLFFIFCYCLVIFFPLTQFYIILFLIFSVISSFIIIKDESVHKKYCATPEQFLHAILFILHPIILIILFLCWPLFSEISHPKFVELNLLNLKKFIIGQFFLSIIFLFYQIIYWNFIFKDIKRDGEVTH